MNIKEYIENPMGKGDATLGQNRKVIVSTLTEKYDNLTNHKDIKMKCYIASIAIPTKYYIHLIIPSETERGNTYDVIFEFTKDKDKPMVNWDVRVFSNSPSFAYTFAYVYLKNDLMIKSLAKKLGKEFVKIEPSVRNRYKIVSYEKYIFFGAKFILDSKILNADQFSKKAVQYTTTTYPGKCRTLEQIMKEYDGAAGKLARKKRQEQKKMDEHGKKSMLHPSKVESGIHTISKKKKTMGHAGNNMRAVQHISKR